MEHLDKSVLFPEPMFETHSQVNPESKLLTLFHLDIPPVSLLQMQLIQHLYPDMTVVEVYQIPLVQQYPTMPVLPFECQLRPLQHNCQRQLEYILKKRVLGLVKIPNSIRLRRTYALGKSSFEKTINRHVFPQHPSPTTTNFLRIKLDMFFIGSFEF